MNETNKKYGPRNINIMFKGKKLSTVDEKDMVTGHLRNDDIECCGCGESDYKKLEHMTFTMQYKKATLKPTAFICYDCIEKIKTKGEVTK